MKVVSIAFAVIAALATAMASTSLAQDKPPKSFIWAITGLPPAAQIEGAIALPVTVTVGPVPATGLRLLPTTFSEQSRLRPLAPMKLCKAATGDCTNVPAAIEANTTSTVWLRVDDSHPSPGKYGGSVVFASNEKPQGDSVAMTIYSTNLCAQLVGVLVIVVGVALGWFVTQFAHSRFSRDQMLLPARLLADRAQHLLELVRQGNTAAPASKMEGKLLELLSLLDPTSLELGNLIPSSMPAPWSNPAAQSGAAQVFYQKVSDLLSVAGVIVTEGLQVIWLSMPADPAQTPTPSNAKNAIDKLDVILAAVDCSTIVTVNSAAVPGVSTVVQQVGAITSDWKQSFGVNLTARMQQAASGADAANSPHQISMDIRNISQATWLVVLVLSAVAGSYQLIYQNLGFGIGADYFLCFFWGLGMPVGAGQLLQMNGGTAAAALQLQLPK